MFVQCNLANKLIPFLLSLAVRHIDTANDVNMQVFCVSIPDILSHVN